jgi:hypothetical protein
MEGGEMRVLDCENPAARALRTIARYALIVSR